jgi:hypothetical protein
LIDEKNWENHLSFLNQNDAWDLPPATEIDQSPIVQPDGMDALVSIDNVDDRQELLRLMEFLSPGERVRFLRWAATLANGPYRSLRPNGSTVSVYVTNTTGEAAESYLDLCGLIAQWRVPRDVVLRELERLVRQISRRTRT